MNLDPEMIRALPWHVQPWQRVQDAIRTGQLGHALLLAGPAGVGKRRFAARLAARLMCESPDVDGEACGHCRGCAQTLAGSHPNLNWLQREFNDRKDKLKRDISMEQLRRMMESLSLSSHYGRTRVVVIDPADAMNANGVNAVLKTRGFYRVGQIDSKWMVPLNVVQEIKGIDSDMLRWWWDHIGNTERYRLWQPIDHVTFEWTVEPNSPDMQYDVGAVQKVKEYVARLSTQLWEGQS